MPARVDARCELRLPQELLDRVDAVAGGRGNRSKFARRALEAALSDRPVTPAPTDAASAPAAAARIPVPAPADSPLAEEAAPPRAPGIGCPECGGALAGVLDQPGVNACVDCGWRG